VPQSLGYVPILKKLVTLCISIPVSMIDAANPTVFVAARDVGIRGTELPVVLERDTVLMGNVETIRRHAAVAMGMSPDLDHAGNVRSVPKLGILSPPVEQTLLSGKVMAEFGDRHRRAHDLGRPAAPRDTADQCALPCRRLLHPGLDRL
jgi:2-methylaconitate cis-trans-isomerase PrpF